MSGRGPMPYARVAARAAAIATAAGLAMLLGGCGGDDVADAPSSTSTPGTASSSPSGSARATAPPAARSTAAPGTPAGTTARRTGRVVDVTKQGLAFFATPSRNIQCFIQAAGGDASDYVRCAISGKVWKTPPRPADCPVDYGDVSLSTDGPSFVCAGDTVANPDGRIVAYGDSIRAGRITCASSEQMLRCRSAETGHGFELSTQRYRFF